MAACLSAWPTKCRGCEDIDGATFAICRGGLTSLQDITEAGVGDKCLMDTLIPAVEAFEHGRKAGRLLR